MKVHIHASWQALLGDYFAGPAFSELRNFVRSEYSSQRIYPPAKHIFAALDACPFDKVRVVILGQDPYHGPGQAHGLCFSVPQGIEMPPSLRNIFRELKRDLGVPMPTSGDLSAWAAQGVLLLNAVLTVAAGLPNSHQGKGWEAFTDKIIALLSEKKEHVVFMLWGAYAQRKGAQIDPAKHKVLETSHPSPFSVERGFAGCCHFSQANTYLQEKGFAPIDWAKKIHPHSP